MTAADLYRAELGGLLGLCADIERFVLEAVALTQDDALVQALADTLGVAGRTRALVLLVLDRLGEVADPAPAGMFQGPLASNPLPTGQKIQIAADLQRAAMLLYASVANTCNLAGALDDDEAPAFEEVLAEINDLFEGNDLLHARLCRRATGR